MCMYFCCTCNFQPHASYKNRCKPITFIMSQHPHPDSFAGTIAATTTGAGGGGGMSAISVPGSPASSITSITLASCTRKHNANTTRLDRFGTTVNVRIKIIRFLTREHLGPKAIADLSTLFCSTIKELLIHTIFSFEIEHS